MLLPVWGLHDLRAYDVVCGAPLVLSWNRRIAQLLDTIDIDIHLARRHLPWGKVGSPQEELGIRIVHLNHAGRDLEAEGDGGDSRVRESVVAVGPVVRATQAEASESILVQVAVVGVLPRLAPTVNLALADTDRILRSLRWLFRKGLCQKV